MPRETDYRRRPIQQTPDSTRGYDSGERGGEVPPAEPTGRTLPGDPRRTGGVRPDPNEVLPPPPPSPFRDNYVPAPWSGGSTLTYRSGAGRNVDAYGQPASEGYAPSLGSGMGGSNYEAGGPPQYSPGLTTGDPYDMAQEDRRFSYDRGNRIDQDLRDETMLRRNLEDNYRTGMLQGYDDLRQTPGYTQDEAGNIIRSGINDLALTPEQIASYQFTDDEQSGIRGNPGSQFQYFNPADQLDTANRQYNGVTGAIGDYGNKSRTAFSGMSDRTRGAIDPRQLTVGQDYMNQQDAAIQGGEAGARGAYQSLGSGQDQAFGEGSGAVRGFTGNPNLGVSGEYQQDMRFGPQDQYNMRMSAITGIGNATRAEQDRVERAASASGYNSPMALAAGLNRLQVQGDVNAQDAANNASVTAKRLGLDVTQQREDTRLGAEQYRSGLGAQSELGLLNSRNSQLSDRAGIASNTELALQRSRLGAAGEREGYRQGGQQFLTNANVGNERALGQSLMDLEGRIGGMNADAQMGLGDRQIDARRYITDTGMGAMRDVDAKQSDRNAGLAANRQQVSMGGQQTRFGQGFDANNMLSNQYRGVADARLGGQAEWRNWATGQSNKQADLGTQARGQRINNFGTQAGAQQGSTGDVMQYDLGRRGQSGFGAFKRGFGGALGSALGAGMGSGFGG